MIADPVVPELAAQAPLVAQAAAKAGAADADITPLPGVATGGYGPAGAYSRGYWGRLRAVAFYFEDPSGRGLALVSADLFAIPGALHTDVAKHFTAGNPANTTGVVLPYERLVIAATHTHQGPGNYMSARVYNDLGSPAHGFNEPLRAFLQAGIIRAIEEAVVDARSAAHSSVETLTGSVNTATLFRNRSPEVFKGDPDHTAILAALGSGIPDDASLCEAARLPGEPDDDWNVSGCPRLRAVDRNVTLLRIRHGARTRALALFVNVHPTVLAPRTELLSGDLFSHTRARLEVRLGEDPPVIGFFNGSEGDVVTRRTARTATDLATLGEAFAGQIHRIYAESPATPVDLTQGVHGRLHYALPGAVETPSGRPAARLASEAMAGVAMVGGGEGDETRLSRFTARRTRKPTGDQGVKVPAFGWFRQLIVPARNGPQALPLGVIRVGTLTVITTPTENSTAATWQLRNAVGGGAHGVLEVISMANEYASYLSTSGEYALQDYMGASTLWGPDQSNFFAAVIGRIAHETEGTTGEPGTDKPGPKRSFRPGDVGGWRARPQNGYDDFLEGGFVEGEDLPTFEWCEPTPQSVGAGDRQVEVTSVDGSLRDRDGIAVILRGIRKNPDHAIWAAIWLTPLWETRRDVYRFRVTTPQRTIESATFAVGTSPPRVCPEMLGRH